MSSILNEIQPKCSRRKDNLKLPIINFQSIQNKVPEFETFTMACQPDVIISTETWVTPDIGNSEVFWEEYAVFHKDRVWKTGGGVLIAVHKIYFSSEEKTENNNCELIFVTIQLKDQKYLIVRSSTDQTRMMTNIWKASQRQKKASEDNTMTIQCG